MPADFDAIVIGAGPGGETAASRLHDGGLRVALVERELIGGECAYWACIPSKTLLRAPEARTEASAVAGLSAPGLDWPAVRDYRDSMIRHLDDTAQVESYRAQGVTVIKGAARVVGRGPWRIEVGGQQVSAGHLIIATGSEARRPPVEGLDRAEVWTNREATTLRDIPERAVLIGGSAVGVELGQFLARMGSEVTLVQRGERLLTREEPRVGELVADQLARDGVRVCLGRQVTAVRGGEGESVVELDDGHVLGTGVVILGTGRRPRTGGLGLEDVGVSVNRQQALDVDEYCRVTDDGLWALGDVTGIAMFTHVALYQARVVADTILGTPRRATYSAIPRVIFAHPEIAAVGLTAERAHAAGVDLASAEVDLPEGLARPWTYQTAPSGTLGLLADREQRTVVGAWAVAPLAGEWIHQAALAIRARVPIDVLLDTITQFPTFSQAYLQAAERLEL